MPIDPARRRLVVAGAAFALTSAVALLPSSRRIPRVAWLTDHANLRRRLPGWPTIRERFVKHGLVDGRDFFLTFEHLYDDAKQAEQKMRRLVASRPDVIALGAHPDMWLLKDLTWDIPIVFHNLTSNPVELGLVESLSRPGRNITGTSHAQDWTERMLTLLREIKPDIKIVASLVGRGDLQSHTSRPWVLSVEARMGAAERIKAARQGIDTPLILLEPDASTEDIAAAIRRSRAEGLMAGPMTPAFQKFLETSPIPSVGMAWQVAQGALMGLKFDMQEGVAQAVAMVARILRGESPATIPIYQQTRYTVALNLRTAESAGIRIPDSLLAQATQIVR